MTDFSFAASSLTAETQKKLAIEFLPAWAQNTEQIQKFFSGAIQQWFTPENNDTLNGYIGTKGSSDTSKLFINESDSLRNEYQLSPSYVSKSSSNTILGAVPYQDLIDNLKNEGALTENESRLLSGSYYSWAPPINPDMFVNYSNYYWDNENSNSITTPYYIVMERGSIDGNLWSAFNFWYYITDSEVSSSAIASGKYVQATRPIIQFEKNIELYNFGRYARTSVDLVSNTLLPQDIMLRNLSDNIEIDGEYLQDGDRVLFTSISTNKGENNRVYKVTAETLNGVSVYGLYLDPSDFSPERPTGEPVIYDTIRVNRGSTYKNTVLWWDSTEWVLGQQKTEINQDIRFKLFNKDFVSLDDSTIYPGSTFNGNSMFTYYSGTTYVYDSTLNRNVTYNSNSNIEYYNAMQSEKYYYNGTTELSAVRFYKILSSTKNNDVYYSDWRKSPYNTSQSLVVTVPVQYTIDSSSQYNYVYEYSMPAVPSSTDYNAVRVTIDGTDLIYKSSITDISNLSTNEFFYANNTVYVNYDFTYNSYLKISVVGNTKLIDDAVYEIPHNLKNNANNETISIIDSSVLIYHFMSIIENQAGLTGTPYGTNNYSSTAKDISRGTELIQHDASLLPAMAHYSADNLNLVQAINYSKTNYNAYRNRFTQLMNTLVQTGNTNTDAEICSTIIETITQSKSSEFAFWLSGMAESLSSATYIPCTPAFLGITSVYVPKKAVKKNLNNSGFALYNVSHMGQLSKAYSTINLDGTITEDRRDNIIYTLEMSIYNSINASLKQNDYIYPYSKYDIRPGIFRSTEFTKDEYNSIFLREFKQWAYNEDVDYKTNNEFVLENWKTYNYSTCTYHINNKSVKGSWRNIYLDYFDTLTPHLTPWEMLGFSIKPTWWDSTYTSTITVGSDTIYTDISMWNDISTGTIKQGNRAGIDSRFARPGIINYIPYDFVTGALSSPWNAPAGRTALINAKPSAYNASLDWVIGDNGLVEYSYKQSNYYKFDECIGLYLAKPAKFMNYFWDTLNYSVYSLNGSSQFLNSNSNTRLSFNASSSVHGEDDVAIYGYQTWVSDYLKSQHYDITASYGRIIRGSTAQLMHRLGGFSTDTSLTFTSDSFGLIPQENAKIKLIKSAPRSQAIYSAVKVTYKSGKYIVDGYDASVNSFTYKTPVKSGLKYSNTINGITVVDYKKYNTTESTLEYGSSMNTIQDVYQFITGYGEYLTSQGWIFEDVDSSTGEVFNWNSIGSLFVSWAAGALSDLDYVTLTPSAKAIKFGSTFGFIDNVGTYSGGLWSLIDETYSAIDTAEIDIVRLGNVTVLRMLDSTDKKFMSVRLNLVEFEHAVIFDNTTIFNNIMYLTAYGLHQQRLRVNGTISGSWTGRLEAPGYMIVDNTTLPNFEKLVNDFSDYYNSENPNTSVAVSDLSKHLIGFQTREFLNNLISTDSNKFSFYKGYIREKGTKQSFDKVLRVVQSSENTQDYKVFEEWAIKVGEYGNVKNSRKMEFNLLQSEIKQDPQVITFDDTATSDSPMDNVITYFGSTGVDSRWITRPATLGFPVVKRNTNFIDLPYYGPINVNEVSFITEDYTTIEADRIAYITKNSTLPTSVWMLNNFGTWDIFDVVNTGLTVQSVVVDSTAGTSTITTNAAITLDTDTPIFIYDSSSLTSNINIDVFYYGDNSNSFTVNSVLSANTYTSNNPVIYKYVNRYNDTTKAAFVSARDMYVPNNTYFNRPVVYNNKTDLTETYLNVWDPLQGMIPGIARSEISYITQVDPALYNSTDANASAWGNNHVGEVWWDTSTARYLDYTQVQNEADPSEYMRKQWGKMLPNSSIDVYEWVKSPVLPSSWDDYVSTQSTANKSETDYLPSGTVASEYWSEIQEYDYTIADYKMYYYFWVKNSIYVPEVSFRKRAIADIANIILDPTALNIPWFAAVNQNSFIVSGLSTLVDETTSVLQLNYKITSADTTKHSQWLLMKEKDSYTVDSTLWSNMVNSICASDSSNNLMLYPYTELGNDDKTVWFKDVLSARKILVQSLNSIFGSYSTLSDTYFSTNVLNYASSYSNPYSMKCSVVLYNATYMLKIENASHFAESDSVLLTTNGTLPYPLNANQQYYLHVVDASQGIFRLKGTSTSKTYFNIADKGEGQMYCTKQSENSYSSTNDLTYKMTDYWSIADWYNTGYSSSTPYTEYYDLSTVKMSDHIIGDVIKIVNTSTKEWDLYVLAYSRSVKVWNTIGKSSSTIQLNSKLYTDYSVVNSSLVATNQELISREILRLLLSNLSDYESTVFFDLLFYVHNEQKVINWANKTSYISITGISKTLTSSTLSDSDPFTDALLYFNEVKPYRTKIRKLIAQRTSDSDSSTVTAFDSDPLESNRTALSNINYDGTAQDFSNISTSFRQQLDVVNFDIVTGTTDDVSSLSTAEYYLDTYNSYFEQKYLDNCTPRSLVVQNASSNIYNGSYSEIVDDIPSFSAFRNVLSGTIVVDESKTVFKNGNDCYIWYLYNYGWVMSTESASVVYYVDNNHSAVENTDISEVTQWAQIVNSVYVVNYITISSITERTLINTKLFNSNPISENTLWLKNQWSLALTSALKTATGTDCTSIIKDNSNSIFKPLQSEGYYFDTTVVKSLFSTLTSDELATVLTSTYASCTELLSYYNNAANRLYITNSAITQDEINTALDIGFKGTIISGLSNYRVSPGYSSALDESVIDFMIDYGIYLQNGTIQKNSTKGKLDVDYLQDDYFEYSDYGKFTWDLNTTLDNTTNIGSANDNPYYADNEYLNDPMALNDGYIDDEAAYDQTGYEDATTELVFESISTGYTSDTVAISANANLARNLYDISSLTAFNDSSNIKAHMNKITPDMLTDIDYGIYYGTGVITGTYGILNVEFGLHVDYTGTNDNAVNIDLDRSFMNEYNVNVGDFSVECDIILHPQNRNIAIISAPTALSYIYEQWRTEGAISESEYALKHKRNKHAFTIDTNYFNSSSTILRVQNHAFSDNDIALICFNTSNSSHYTDIKWVNVNVIDSNYITFNFDQYGNSITSPAFGEIESLRKNTKVYGCIYKINPIPQGCDIKFNVVNYTNLYDRFISGGSLEQSLIGGVVTAPKYLEMQNSEPVKFVDDSVGYYNNTQTIDEMFDLPNSTDTISTGFISGTVGGTVVDNGSNIINELENWYIGDITTVIKTPQQHTAINAMSFNNRINYMKSCFDSSYNYIPESTDTTTSWGFSRPGYESTSARERNDISVQESLNIKLSIPSKSKYYLMSQNSRSLKTIFSNIGSTTDAIVFDVYYNATSISCTVSNSSKYPNSGVIMINDELIRYEELTVLNATSVIFSVLNRGYRCSTDTFKHQQGSFVQLVPETYITESELYPADYWYSSQSSFLNASL